MKGGSKNGNTRFIHFAKQLGVAASLMAFDTRSLFSSCCVAGCLEDKGEPRQGHRKRKAYLHQAWYCTVNSSIWDVETEDQEEFEDILCYVKSNLGCIRPCPTEKQGKGRMFMSAVTVCSAGYGREPRSVIGTHDIDACRGCT